MRSPQRTDVIDAIARWAALEECRLMRSPNRPARISAMSKDDYFAEQERWAEKLDRQTYERVQARLIKDYIEEKTRQPISKYSMDTGRMHELVDRWVEAEQWDIDFTPEQREEMRYYLWRSIKWGSGSAPMHHLENALVSLGVGESPTQLERWLEWYRSSVDWTNIERAVSAAKARDAEAFEVALEGTLERDENSQIATISGLVTCFESDRDTLAWMLSAFAGETGARPLMAIAARLHDFGWRLFRDITIMQDRVVVDGQKYEALAGNVRAD
ncbi:MAG: hypothetical protein AAFY15_11440, partial [Cyanobacteria bacterium J06648_11]